MGSKTSTQTQNPFIEAVLCTEEQTESLSCTNDGKTNKWSFNTELETKDAKYNLSSVKLNDNV